MMQHTYRSRYSVVMNENTYVSVYKYEKYNFDQPFLSFQVKNLFIGKSELCGMTEFSGALNNSNFDGNTILLECEDSKYVYISGLGIFELRTIDKIIDYISLMGNNTTPFVFAVGEKYIHFISTHHKCIENDKTGEGTLLNSSNDSLDPNNYHLEKSGSDCFKKVLECNRIQSCLPVKECGFMEEFVEDEENVTIQELKYTDGSNEVVKNFRQKCGVCLERDNDFIIKQCGHQCICKDGYQNKGDIDILKCVVCRK